MTRLVWLFVWRLALRLIAVVKNTILYRIRHLPTWNIASLLLFLIFPAHADVWGFIDARGVAYFATEKIDDRYELYFKGGESFDTSKVVVPAAADPSAPAGPVVPVIIPAVPARLLTFFDTSPNYKVVKPHIQEAAKTHKIDYELLQALIATESGFDVAAVSPKGALGLMQLMPDTARRFGIDSDRWMAIEKKLVDPKINIKTGTRYLRLLLNMFPGRLDLALASYNAGEGAVQKAGNQIPNYKETQNYVKTVMGLYTGLKPSVLQAPVVQAQAQAAPAEPRYPTRIRMEMLGGAARRGNMLAPLGTTAPGLPNSPGTPGASGASNSATESANGSSSRPSGSSLNSASNSPSSGSATTKPATD